jgi:WD40 repeat protein
VKLDTTTPSGKSSTADLRHLSISLNILQSFWEALSGICSRTIQHPESQVNRLCITPDKKFLAAAGRHVVRLYDIKSSNPNPIMTFEGHTNNITGVAFHCEGKWMVTSSEDQTVKVWDTRSGTIQRNYQHTHPVNDVVIHPNQGELVSADRGGNIRVWDLGESKCTHQLIPAEDVSVASVSVATDGSLLAAGNNKVRRPDAPSWSQLTKNRAMFTSGRCFRTTSRQLCSPAESSRPTKII